MTPETVLQLGRNALEMSLILAGPVLVFGLVAGLVVAIFQALTQIHEMTLTFIPKIVAVAFALLFFLSWMINLVVDFTARVINSIPSIAS